MSNVRNADALARLVGICTGLGGQYNPGQQNLKVVNLQTLLGKAQEALLKVSTTKTVHENATNQREVLYAQLRVLITRVMAELNSSGALPQTIDDAETMVRKIKGIRASSVPEETAAPQGQGEQPTVKRRARGTDYISVTQHFEKLLETLAAEPLYQPTVGELKLAQLQALLVSIRQSNKAVTEAFVALKAARHQRNAIFYGKSNGMLSTARQVKNKVKALFGFSSTAYQDVRKISFTQPM